MPDDINLRKECIFILYGFLNIHCKTYGKVATLGVQDCLGEDNFLYTKKNPAIDFIEHIKIEE